MREHHVGRAVGEQDGDTQALSDTQAREPPGLPIGQTVEIAKGQTVMAGNKRKPIRERGRSLP
jgi:hypothetical protein